MKLYLIIVTLLYFGILVDRGRGFQLDSKYWINSVIGDSRFVVGESSCLEKNTSHLAKDVWKSLAKKNDILKLVDANLLENNDKNDYFQSSFIQCSKMRWKYPDNNSWKKSKKNIWVTSKNVWGIECNIEFTANNNNYTFTFMRRAGISIRFEILD
eukprot:TRINITY_DN10691_c0_g1_i2.p1 TRINITY_DN10691_c0_g1~~TRINITY_DN10691_c0_g1_i2.p1  ORF type:complete len:156 (-),score=9.98 TRINITY_DN10691_c0_g1_i2:82-549(-)